MEKLLLTSMDIQNHRFHAWWEKLPNAFAYHQVLVDKKDKPLDYVFLYVNAAFEKMTGLKKDNIIGKKVTEVIPGIEKSKFDWIGTYGKVALDKKTIRFEQYSEPLNRWYDVTAFSDEPGHFATVFFDITQIKKTEKRLRQSEERNRSMIEALPDILIICDKEGRYLDVIAPSKEKLYQPKEEVLGKKISELFPNKEAKKVMEAIKKSIKTQSLQIVEYQLEVPTGKLYFEARITPFEKDKVLALIRDITQKKQAEDELNRFKIISDNALYGKAIAGIDGKLVYVNRFFADIHGYAPEELIEKHLSVCHAPEQLGELDQTIARMLEEDHFEPQEIWHVHRSGKVFPMLMSGVVIKDEQNRPQYLAVSAIDITQKKQAEQALQESEKKHRRLFETMAQGIIYQDAKGKIISANPAAERMLGQTFEQMQTKTSDDPCWASIAKDGSQVSGSEHPAMIALRTGKPVGPFVMGIFNPKIHEHVWLSINAIPLFFPKDKKPFQVYATFDDITAKIKAEQALKEQLAFERLFSDISSRFINLSHDETDHAINIALKQTGSFFQVDRSYILQFSSDQKSINNTHEWCADGIESQIDTIKHFSLENISWWTGQMKSLPFVYVPDIEKLPASAGSEKKEWARQSIQSLITIPIKVDGRLIACFGFDSVKRKRVWTEQEITLLKVLTDIMSNALTKYDLERRNQQAHQSLIKLFDSIDEAIYVTNMKTYEILYMNNYAKRLWKDVRGRKCWKILQKDQEGPCSFCTNDRLLDKEGQSTGVYIWQQWNSKTNRWYQWRDVAIQWIDEDMVAVKLATDITDAKKAEEKILYIGFHDSLTSLYNRSYMEQEMARLDTPRQLPISIIMADLNGLKLVNDTYGHSIGDKMLQKTAAILKEICRKEDIIARWGGDEFVILLPQTPQKQAESIARRILKYCEQVHIQDLPVSLALGVSHKDSYKIDLLEVLKQAENKMYDHKLTQSRSARSTIVNALLETLKEKSFETEQHIRKMQACALVMGKSLSLSEAETDRLLLLVMLHDIGKVNIPKEILTKKGKLTPRQWAVIKEHPQTGYRIALAIPEFSHLAEDILCHHERWDGSGYPRGLKEKGIPLFARILAIADAYEVMTNGRVYKKALTKDQAIDELCNCAGSQFDPDLVKAFIPSLT